MSSMEQLTPEKHDQTKEAIMPGSNGPSEMQSAPPQPEPPPEPPPEPEPKEEHHSSSKKSHKKA